MRRGMHVLAVVGLLAFSMSLTAQDQQGGGNQGMAAQAKISKMATASFQNIPGLPTCTTAAVYSGNPGEGSALLMVKATSGCQIPWHWHTFAEDIMMVSGRAKLEMKDGATETLAAGDFAPIPGKHQHQFTCTKTCQFHLWLEGKFDIHYVDKDGNEIPPEQALKAQAKPKAKPKQ